MTGMVALGLVGALALYVGTVYVISWSSRREVAIASRSADGDSKLVGPPSAMEIAKRQGLSWTAFLSGTFVLLNLIGVPLWQQLLFAAVFAGFFASIWLRRARGWRPDTAPAPLRLKGRLARRWSLVWLDGFSFMALLCFAIDLIWRLVD